MGLRKVVFYINSLDKGGAQRVMVNLAEAFVRDGMEVTIVTTKQAETEFAVSGGIGRVYSEIAGEELTDSRLRNFWNRLMKLRSIWKTEKPDIIVSFIGKYNFMAIVSSLFLQIPVVVSVRGEPRAEYETKLMRFLAKTLFLKAKGIILQTEASRAFFPCYLQKKITVLQNSLNPLFLRDRFEGSREKQIVSVGRLDTNKNQAMLIKAFSKIAAKYPEYSVIFYGEGERKAALSELAAGLHVEDRVLFPGIVADVTEAIRKASLFVLTSDTEGMPNALIEAMALGLPVISTNCPCGGPAELIREGKDGMLIPVRDNKALAEKMDLLLGNPELAEQMGRNATKVQERMRPEIINRKWKDYLAGKVQR